VARRVGVCRVVSQGRDVQLRPAHGFVGLFIMSGISRPQTQAVDRQSRATARNQRSRFPARARYAVLAVIALNERIPFV